MLEGSKMTLESRLKIGRAGLGRIPWNKGKKMPQMIGNTFAKGFKCSEKNKEYFRKINLGKTLTAEHKEKIRQSHFGIRPSAETKEKNRLAHIGKNSGVNNPCWKGGITPIHNKIRASVDSKLWINAVFSRDNFTCQKTGIRGGDLTAHHILNFSKYPELRFAIDNGITLSIKSHLEFHKKYGKTNNTREQLEEFLNNK